MNFISPNTAAQYNIQSKIQIQNIQVIQKKLYKEVGARSCTMKLSSIPFVCTFHSTDWQQKNVNFYRYEL